MSSSSEVLEENGLLSKVIPGYQFRAAQLEMSVAIENAIKTNSQLVIEAGTGTGKTFGYLVPVFLSDKKTIVSTGTKNLQDQLFLKDIPTLKKIFYAKRKIVLLKGRSNYLCLYRLEKNLEDGRLPSKDVVYHLARIHEWSKITKKGDINELNLPEDSSVWPLVTSTAENCLNQDCSFYKECFVTKVRQKALTADILIVNHHLFFADLLLQKEGFGELLPGADVIIFDESHHLPEMATQFFSTSITSRQFLQLGRDILNESEEVKDVNFTDECHELEKSMTTMRMALGEEMGKKSWPTTIPSKLEHAIVKINDLLVGLEEKLKIAAVRTKGLENCWKRVQELLKNFHSLTTKNNNETIHWFETFMHSFALHFTPLKISENFKRIVDEKKKTWIFTSATLTVDNSFQLFTESLGLKNSIRIQLKSPFNYREQALLYVPRGLPDPNSPHYIEKMLSTILNVVNETKGRAFILFTSHRALDTAATWLSQKIDFPLLIQGSYPKHILIEEFKRLGNAVLLGTNSFWHGVDVRGEALSCVIIDRLPFASPDDPVLKARIQLLKKEGVDAFRAYQLPNAVLALKQGVGRLIRDITDKGLLMICDPRIVGNSYSEIFIRSLPEMSRTREFAKIKHFFKD